MSLKILMEDKKLDFNQPLLSVRRFPSILGSDKVKTKTFHSLPVVPVLPSYKSELKSGPVSSPGTVPFTWEKSPGRPKNERKSQTLDHPPIIPKLPPGRVPEVRQEGNARFIGCGAGKTPFSTRTVSPIEENVTKFEKESSDSEDCDEEYLDAFDTLSRTESYFVNCSASGLSGLEGSEVKPSGTFSTDAQTRDFIMGRFLPAAKAMTSETPQYDLWKQLSVQEWPRQLSEVISGDKQPPLNPSLHNNIFPYFPEYYQEEDSADEADYEPGNLSPKLCGLLPKLCLKSSLCLLHPVAGISVRTQVQISSVKRTQATSSSVASCQETKKERMSVNHEQKSIGGHQKTELGKYENMTRNKCNQVQKLEGSSLYRLLQGSGIPTQQNKIPKSRFYEEKCFPDLPKEEKTLYVDSVHKEVSPNFKAVEEIPLKDSLLTDIEKSGILRESIHSDCSPLSFSGKSDQEMGMKILECFRQDRDLCKESIVSENVKFRRNGYLDHEDNQQKLVKLRNLENSQRINSQFPVPPPLPKSPSESWLWRTLPLMSTRNSSPHLFHGTKKNSPHYASRTPSVNPKWETIVKTTKVQQQHFPSAEDLVTAAPKIVYRN